MNPDISPLQTTPQTEATPPPRAPRRKKTIVALVGIAVVLIVGVVAGVLYSSQQKKPATADNNPVSYDRPGYDRKTLGNTVGDPLALSMTAKKEKQTLSDGSVVIPACSVLSQDDLQKQGLQLYASDYGFPVQQNYLSKTGKA